MYNIGEPGVLAKSSRYICFPSDFAKSSLFFLERCGHYFLDRRYIISRKAPHEIRFLFLYVVKGSLSLIIGSKDYVIHENEIALIDTRQQHIYAANGTAEMYWLGFDGISSESFVDRICKYGHVYVPVHSRRTEEYFKEILEAFHEKHPLSEEMTSGYIHMILSDLMERANMRMPKQESVIHQSIRYIQNHYGEPITLTELAAAACLNPSYFSTKFKQATGYSPKEYLIDTRIRAAKTLLLTTDLSIHQISEDIGFQNDAYFSRLFHKKTGVTPSNWKNLHT